MGVVVIREDQLPEGWRSYFEELKLPCRIEVATCDPALMRDTDADKHVYIRGGLAGCGDEQGEPYVEVAGHSGQIYRLWCRYIKTVMVERV